MGTIDLGYGVVVSAITPPPTEQRKPRPLTDEERERLREKNGGKASPEQLEDLARRFQRPDRDRSRKGGSSHKSNNGWR